MEELKRVLYRYFWKKYGYSVLKEKSETRNKITNELDKELFDAFVRSFEGS